VFASDIVSFLRQLQPAAKISGRGEIV
jgi:hypothetical protein